MSVIATCHGGPVQQTPSRNRPEGIPGEPASCENSAFENKEVASAVAQPFLTSIDSLGFGLPCPVSAYAIIPALPSKGTSTIEAL
jgi:hypothetical protein